TRVPTPVDRHELSRENYESLRSEMFEQVAGRRPSPNIPALDDALIRTISLWKRSLNAELGGQTTNAQLAGLFNALIFARALEDQRRRLNGAVTRRLLERWMHPNPPDTIRVLLARVLRELADQDVPTFLFREADIAIFDGLDRSVVYQ